MKTKFQKDCAFHKIWKCIKTKGDDPMHRVGCNNMIKSFKQMFIKDFPKSTKEDVETLRDYNWL